MGRRRTEILSILVVLEGTRIRAIDGRVRVGDVGVLFRDIAVFPIATTTQGQPEKSIKSRHQENPVPIFGARLCPGILEHVADYRHIIFDVLA